MGNNTNWNFTTSTGATADFYWIGGGGNWSNPARWSTVSGDPAYSSGCIPGPGNNVFFDANSGFTSANKTVTIDVNTAACKNMDWTGSGIPIVKPIFNSNSSLNTLDIYGSLTLITDMTWNVGCPVHFESTTSGNTITSSGRSFTYDVFFNGAGGSWTLQDNFSCSSYSVVHNYGTINTNSKDFYMNTYSSNNTNTRGLILGSTLMTITSGDFNVGQFNNFTLSSGTSTIRFTSGNGIYCWNANSKKAFWNLEYTSTTATNYINNTSGYPFSFNNVTFASHGNLNGNSRFNNLTFAAGKTYTLETGKTDTIIGTWTLPGQSGQPIVLKSSSGGSQAIIYKTNLCVLGDWMNITDIKVTGGAQYYCGPPAHSSIINSPGWHNATSNSLWLGYSTNWNDPANWDLNGAIPNLATKVKLSVCAYYQPIITAAGAYCDSLYIETGGSLTLQGTNTLDVYGNWGMQVGGTFTPNNGTINFKGNTILDVNAPVQFHDLAIASGNKLTMVGNDILRVNGDFTNNGTFNPASGKVAFNGSGQQTIKTNGTVFNKIEFNNSNLGCDDIFLTDDMTFTDSANFIHGVLNYNPGTVRLRIPDNAKCNSGTTDSYVNGEVVKSGNDAFIFPIGSCYWAPLGMDAPATASAIAAVYVSAPSPHGYYLGDMCPGSGLDHTSGVEYWDVTTDNDHPQITLYWKDGTHSGISSLAQTEFAHYEDCGGTDHWVKKTGSKGGTASNGWVKSTGLTSYSPLTLGSTTGSNTLPVTMLNFDAICLNNSIKLEWQTASETNSDYFLVESSKDMVNWKSEGKVSAAGNSSELRNYSFIVNRVTEGENYYRLRQFDFDGLNYKYGPIASNCAGSEAKVEIFPNPVDEQLNIHCTGYNGKNAIVVIHDVAGRVVYERSYSSLKEANIILELKDLTPGLYQLEFISDDNREYFKLVKN